MNLTDQTVSGTNQVSLQNSLNASLMKLKVTTSANTTAPTDNDCFIYVDKASKENPTEERKQYLFELKAPLRYFDSVGDELLQEFKIVNNDVVMETTVTRKVGVQEDGTKYVLQTPEIESIDAYPVTLFEGSNYIYTNYQNVDIEIIYPKDTEEGKNFLNISTYYNHKIKNDGEFSLDDIYFKDAFTKTEDKLNLEVNNASVDCITSNKNNFSLDSDGNLIVKTLTVGDKKEEQLDKTAVCNMVYPVGSLYMSINNTNPADLFGGVWSQIKGRFLLGQGSNEGNTTNYWGAYAAGTCNFPAGEMSGEPYHTLTVNEMPSHTHAQNPHSHSSKAKGFNGTSNKSGYYMLRRNRSDDSYDDISAEAAISTTATNQNTGGSASHNNMPPYLVVYMWKRVS